MRSSHLGRLDEARAYPSVRVRIEDLDYNVTSAQRRKSRGQFLGQRARLLVLLAANCHGATASVADAVSTR
jgi:hypothetical protein